MLSTVQYKT